MDCRVLSSPDDAGRSLPVVPAGGSSSAGTENPVGSDGPVVAGGPLARVRHCLHFSMTLWDC